MTFRIQVDPHFEQHFVWPWFLGIWIPGWPMTPRQGSIALNLQVQILSQGKIHHRIQLTEVEPFDLFWYGIYRDFPLQEKSDFVVRKVQSSLKSLLSSQFCNETPDGVPIW
ncbi:MAG TPA: hypothetical protein VLM37_05015 [Fibrobacteraceae bacterium]|nr:hypothetical protein [Fibrobacteraceae bacterium]